MRTIVRESGIQNGLLLLYNPHTTAGLTINEGADPDVQQDILDTLARLVPDANHYRHLEWQLSGTCDGKFGWLKCLDHRPPGPNATWHLATDLFLRI